MKHTREKERREEQERGMTESPVQFGHFFFVFQPFTAVGQSDDFLKGRTERNVDHGVNKRIDHGRSVSQPNEHRL